MRCMRFDSAAPTAAGHEFSALHAQKYRRGSGRGSKGRTRRCYCVALQCIRPIRYGQIVASAILTFPEREELFIWQFGPVLLSYVVVSGSVTGGGKFVASQFVSNKPLVSRLLYRMAHEALRGGYRFNCRFPTRQRRAPYPFGVFTATVVRSTPAGTRFVMSRESIFRGRRPALPTLS